MFLATLRKHLAARPQPPAAPKDPSVILDSYFTTCPTEQNALDIFEGEWASKFPPPYDRLKAGGIPLFQDTRLNWGINQLGGIYDQDVLELGPLEGGHSYILEREGARSITAIEANSRAYLRCLISKEIVNLTRTKFLCGDFMAYLEQSPQWFDMIVASGVLYHMKDPLRLLQLLATHTDRLYLWTHYFDPQIIRSDPRLQAHFHGESQSQVGGISVTQYQYHYQDSLAVSGFSGGSNRYSVWLSRDGLMSALRECGFNQFATAYEMPDHPHGPCLSLIAMRQPPRLTRGGDSVRSANQGG